MTDKTQARCTCAEVLGEDPDCTLHGVETSWALEHTLPSEWQTQVIELRQMLNEARISHSLPGDVGMREALEQNRGPLADAARQIAIRYGVGGSGQASVYAHTKEAMLAALPSHQGAE